MSLYGLTRPIFAALDPETAHRLALKGLRLGLGGRVRFAPDPRLRAKLWGLEFPSPIGLAAGFDKNAEALEGLLRLGFGFVEAGSVTPRPQPGNPRPRLFRLPEERAVINRMGFNNAGLDVFAANLRARRRPGIVGANLGKNKDSADAVADYVAGVRRLAPLADYLVVNVSSPNTPGLRALQGREPLEALCRAALEARAALDLAKPPPILLKVAPDLTAEDRADVAVTALATGIDGLICCNTTIARPPDLKGPAHEAGGLSGRPLFQMSTEALADFRRLTQGRLPLVGVGGVSSAEDAYAKIRAGASLVQLYAAFAYDGPPLIARMTEGLAALLKRDGFANVADAVGIDVPVGDTK